MLAPKGVKRSRSTVEFDDKIGCTLIITLAKIGNNTLPPFFIFKGVYSTRLMKQHKKVKQGMIAFTDNHWMSSYANNWYFKYIVGYYPNKKIDLVYDFAPNYVSSEVIK